MLDVLVYAAYYVGRMHLYLVQNLW